MRLFLDSSALAKRYVEESGSQRVDELLMAADGLGLAVICVPEIVSGLRRRLRERSLTPADYARAKTALLEDVRDAEIVNLTDLVVATAVRVLERSPVRAMDALQVACAAEWSADVFASADDRQCKAARSFGLRVEQLARAR